MPHAPAQRRPLGVASELQVRVQLRAHTRKRWPALPHREDAGPAVGMTPEVGRNHDGASSNQRRIGEAL